MVSSLLDRSSWGSMVDSVIDRSSWGSMFGSVDRSSWGVLTVDTHWLLLALAVAALAGAVLFRSWKNVRPRLLEERGQYDPITLLITVIVVIVLVVLVLQLLKHV